MSDDLTVLFVGAVAPDDALSAQLEKQHLLVDRCEQRELENMVELAEPSIVVHLGKEGAADSARTLKASSNVRRVRLVMIADRADLAELRKLDRSVVVSLLATDIAAPVIATRVAMLARKGPEKTMPPPAVEDGSEASVPKLPRAPSPPQVKPVKSPLPPVAASASPKNPALGPPRAGTRKSAAPRPLSLAGTSPKSKATAAKAKPAPGTSAKPATAAKAKPTPRTAAKPKPALPTSPVAPQVELKEKPPVSVSTQTTLVPSAKPDAAPKMELRPASKGLGKKRDRQARVLVADNDITRADLIASALRAAGLEARLAPLDAAATRWPLIRQFNPTLILSDGAMIRGPGQVWYQLFQADKQLRAARLVAMPFARLFDEITGDINVRTLIPQIPQLSEGSSTPTLVDEEEIDLEDEERPTLIHNELASDEDARPTIASPSEPPTASYDLSNLAAELDEEERALKPPTPAAGSKPALPQEESKQEAAETLEATALDEIEEVESLPPPASLAELPALDADDLSLDPSNSPPPAEVSADVLLAIEGGENTEAGKTPAPITADTVKAQGTGGGAKWALVAAVSLAVGAGGSWLAWQKGLFSPAETSAAPTPPAQDAPSVPAASPEPVQESDDEAQAVAEEVAGQDAAASGDQLWAAAQDDSVKDCADVVANLEQLEAGGIQQAVLSWSKARKTMVLGDVDKAHVQMCEAALLHDQSLAIEGLVGVYLIKKAPKLAEKWVLKALSVRPDREKTLLLHGDVLSQLGRPEEARKVWTSALKVPDDDQKTLDIVAKQYTENATKQLRGGATAQAESLFRRAATLAPKNTAAMAGLGSTFLAAGDKKNAEAWAKKALEVNERQALALLVLADLAAQEGQKDKAVELYKECLAVEPNNSRAHQQIYALTKK